MPLTPGTRLGPYEVTSLLGAGGMGEVYKARDSRLSREVAVKVLPQGIAERKDALARFKQEARVVATLSHPNILALFDVGEEAGLFYAITELLEGETLQLHLARGPMSVRKALDCGRQLAAGLAAAHEKGVVHRDLKPANVFVTSDGRAKILDFGLARGGEWGADEQELPTRDPATTPGTVLGTLGYMSPEQARGQPADSRSDIFSLGAVLFEMLSGRQAFVRDTAADSLSAILGHDPEEVSRLRPEVPAAVDRVVRRCLEKRPTERFQSARDLAFALESLSDVDSIGAAGLAGREEPSIAVLPFANLSPDPEQEYFCEGIAEEIINALARLENVRVASRSSAFQFKGKSQDLRKVGEALRVRTVLEGGVRSSGKRLRVTAQLVGVADGSTLWSERYDRELEDVFAIQDDISASIVSALRLRLGSTARSSTRPPTADLEAYQLFLKGQHNWYRRERGSLEKAAGFFEQAVERDPSYLAALAGVAIAYASLNFYGAEPASATGKAQAALARAETLDRDAVEVIAARGYVSWVCDLDLRRAEAELRRAVSRNPSYVLGHCWLGWMLISAGRAEEAYRAFQDAVRLDPLSPYALAGAGDALVFGDRIAEGALHLERAREIDADFLLTLFGLGAAQMNLERHDEGVATFERAVLLAGRAPFYLGWLGWAYGRAGRRAEAQSLLDELQRRAKSEYVAPPMLAMIHLGLGQADDAFSWMERGFAERNGMMTMVPRWPVWQSLRTDPRYHELLKRLGLDG